MEDDITQLKEALSAVPPGEREGWIRQFIELVKQKGVAQLRANIYLPTLSADNFESAYRIVVGVMGWELERDTGQVSRAEQRQAFELIDHARKSFPFHQKVELEKLRKTPNNYPLSGTELVQWMLFHKLEAAEKKNESELLKANAGPHQQTLILRYLKSLIFHVGYKRPFRLIGGMTCFLYTFDVSQFEKMYDCLMQGVESEYSRDRYETNLRQHLRDHLDRVFKRFGHFLAIGDDNTPWKEFREVRSDLGSVAPSVELSLKLLLPWDSINRLPKDFGKENTAIPFFATHRKDWRVRSIVGRDRRRLLIDQELLDRIARALNCPPIYGNYFIPRFKKMNNPNTFPADLDQLPKPDDELVKEFRRRGEQHLKRLKRVEARTLFARVDDVRRGQVYDVQSSEPLHLSITPEDKVVEVFTLHGNEEVSLGAVVPDSFGVFDYPEAQRAKVSWGLPGGRKIVARLCPAPDAAIDESGLASKIDLFIDCKKTPFKELLLQPLDGLNINLKPGFPRPFPAALKLASAAILLFLAALFIVYSRGWINQEQANKDPLPVGNAPSGLNPGGGPTPDVAGANQNLQLTAPPQESHGGPPADAPDKESSAQNHLKSKPPADKYKPTDRRQRETPARDHDGPSRYDAELMLKDSVSPERQKDALAALNSPEDLRVDRGVVVPASIGSEGTRGVGSASASLSASPNGTYVKSYRPVLRWSPLDEARTYMVSLWDSKDRLIDSGQPSQPTWQTSMQLAPDEFYRWEVEAKDAAGQTLSPVVKGAFSTLTARRKEEVERDEQRYARSHLLLGITYFKAGLLDEADRELKLLAAANPNSTKAKRLLRRVQSSRTAGRRR
jgi:hypothetical protein